MGRKKLLEDGNGRITEQVMLMAYRSGMVWVCGKVSHCRCVCKHEEHIHVVSRDVMADVYVLCRCL